MELRHLRYFLAVADERHFGRAADRVGIVQPALSIQIKALEDELGTSLFRRTSRHVELTVAGELLVKEARLTLEQAKRAKMVVQRARLGQVGKVRIGFAGNAFFAGILSADLRRFKSLHPDIEIEMREMLAHEQSAAIASRQLDIGYAPRFQEVFNAHITATVIGSWPWAVAMSNGHPLARLKSVSLSSLQDETFVLYASPTNESGHDHLTAIESMLGFEPSSVLPVGSTVTVLALVAAGMGVSLVPISLRDLHIKDVVYRPLTKVKSRSEAVLISSKDDLSPAAAAYVEMARGRLSGRDFPTTDSLP